MLPKLLVNNGLFLFKSYFFSNQLWREVLKRNKIRPTSVLSLWLVFSSSCRFLTNQKHHPATTQLIFQRLWNSKYCVLTSVWRMKFWYHLTRQPLKKVEWLQSFELINNMTEGIKKVGNYRLIKKIGSGATSEVFEARKDGELDKFAVKMIKIKTMSK